MVTIDIDPTLYKKVKAIVKENKLHYPSVKYFVQKHLIEVIEKDEKTD